MERATVDKQRNIVEIDGKKYEIGREIQEQTPQEFFWSLLEGYETKTDFENHPGIIFFLVDGYIVMEFFQKNGDLWVHYEKIWEKIETKFGYNHEEVRGLIGGEVDKHFNLKDVTPESAIQTIRRKVDKHFNLKDVTPISFSFK